MTISIWYRAQGKAPEVIDRANTPHEAAYLVAEYSLAFACQYRQYRYGKDHVWSGRKDQEPPLPVPLT